MRTVFHTGPALALLAGISLLAARPALAAPGGINNPIPLTFTGGLTTVTGTLTSATYYAFGVASTDSIPDFVAINDPNYALALAGTINDRELQALITGSGVTGFGSGTAFNGLDFLDQITPGNTYIVALTDPTGQYKGLPFTLQLAGAGSGVPTGAVVGSGIPTTVNANFVAPRLAAVPEPSSFTLVALGLLPVALLARRRKTASFRRQDLELHDQVSIETHRDMAPPA